MKKLIYNLALIASTTIAMQQPQNYLNTISERVHAACRQENSIPTPSEVFPPQNIPEILFKENSSLFFVRYFYENLTKDNIIGIDIRTECDEKSITEPKKIQTALTLIKILESVGKIKEDKIIVDNDPQMPSKHIIYNLPQNIPDIFSINLPSHLMIRCSHKAHYLKIFSANDLTTKKFIPITVTTLDKNKNILEQNNISSEDHNLFIEHIDHYLQKNVLELVNKEETITSELLEEVYTYRVKTLQNNNT